MIHYNLLWMRDPHVNKDSNEIVFTWEPSCICLYTTLEGTWPNKSQFQLFINSVRMRFKGPHNWKGPMQMHQSMNSYARVQILRVQVFIDKWSKHHQYHHYDDAWITMCNSIAWAYYLNLLKFPRKQHAIIHNKLT